MSDQTLFHDILTFVVRANALLTNAFSVLYKDAVSCKCSDAGGQGYWCSIPGQFTWDLWRTKWHRKSFSVVTSLFPCQYISPVSIFPLSVYFPCQYISTVSIFPLSVYYPCQYISPVSIFRPMLCTNSIHHQICLLLAIRAPLNKTLTIWNLRWRHHSFHTNSWHLWLPKLINWLCVTSG
jgi:hypothetical protein